jgi:hypothetical protein
MGVFPPLALEDTYGDVAVPGSANLHLPAGEVDVTLRSVAPADEPSVPPLSIRISGPDGVSRAEVVENRRTTPLIAGDELVRIWVVRIAQEADYRVDIDGEVYGPYKPTLTFGHVMKNDSLHWLLTIAARLSWLFFICVGGVVLCAVFSTVLGLFFTVGAFHLSSAVRKLLAKPSANL